MKPGSKQTEFPDIFLSGLTLAEKVCVVAPGPNGKNHYHQIPDDFSIIAVNKAVLIENITPVWWVIAHADTDWFPVPDQQYNGIRVYFDRTLDSITETARIRSKDKIYCFSAEAEPLNENEVLPVKGCIRYGASVSALAIQLAYNFGAKEILLCGVDMSGTSYWDNTVNDEPEVQHLHGEIWDSVKRLNPLLHFMRNKLNISVTTLSETKLDVPFYV